MLGLNVDPLVTCGLVGWVYPLSWQLVATQVSVIIAAAATVFTALKSLGMIDWVGRATPGGEPYEAKHKSGGDGR